MPSEGYGDLDRRDAARPSLQVDACDAASKARHRKLLAPDHPIMGVPFSFITALLNGQEREASREKENAFVGKFACNIFERYPADRAFERRASSSLCKLLKE